MILSVTLASLTLSSVLAEAQMRGGGGRGPGGGSSRPEPYNPGRGHDNNGPGRGDNRGDRGNDRGDRGNDRGDRGNDRGGRDDRGGRGNGPSRPSEPSRPNRPSQPTRPSEPSRPNRPSEPTRPSQPNRPSEPNRPGHGGRDDRDNRPGHSGRRDWGGYERDNRNTIERRRDENRRDRDNRRDSFNRDRDNRRNERSSWNNRYRVNPPSRHAGYRDHSTWSSRYDRWWSGASRPSYYSPAQRIRWHRPMPSPGVWRYSEVEQIADNLEYLSRDVFDSMDRVALQNEYGLRLRRVLVGLIDATENFNDSVSDRYDWSDTITDLFYLEAQLDLAEQTLDGYSQAWRVQEEMGSLRYYVNELLWTYRQNF
ncbi:hypothetical protein D3C87_1314660 [compost metagenome]